MCKRKLSDQTPPARNGKRLKVTLQTLTPLSDDVDMELSDRITTVQGFIGAWESELSFIDGLGRENPFAPDFTKRSASTAVQKKVDTLSDQLQEYLEELDREKNLAATNLISGGTGAQAGDGNLYVQFINIGLGDCTLITTPQGRRIMVDCGCDGATQDIVLKPSLKGKTKYLDHLRNQVKNKFFFNGRNEIDMLLLTHTDKDHHNKIKTILKPLKGVKVGLTYYGGTENFSEYGTSAQYLYTVCGTTKARLKQVIVREESVRKTAFTRSINNIDILTTTGTPGAFGKEYIDTNDALVLYCEGGTKPKKSDFKISILAANAVGAWKGKTFFTADSKLKRASEKKGDGSEQNQRSLIVLVECFDQKIMICGDATVVTEYVALNHYKSLLNEVGYQRIGHHGSATSSCKAFVESLKLDKVAIASVGGESLKKHHLPQKAILNNYMPLPVIIKPLPGSHTIYAWDELSRDNISSITNNLWATGSNDTYQLSVAPV